MTEQPTTEGLELVLNQIKSPLDRATALYELASKGVHIPREIAFEYVVYALFVPKQCYDPRGLNLGYAQNFARNMGLTELADLIGRKMAFDIKFGNEQRYLDAVR